MKRPAVLLLCLAAAPAPALAETPPPPGARACTGCHSPAGSATVPPIHGRPTADLAEAMRGFRTGEREATVMGRIAKGFSEAETEAIAAWFSRQPQAKAP